MITDDNILLAGIVSAVALVLGFIFMTLNRKKTVLPMDEFKPFPLIRKTVLSHDTAEYVFGLPTPESILGLPTGQHISLRFFHTDKDGKKSQVMRSYTPVSDNTTLGEIILVVKVYRAGVHPKFPDGGKLSQHLDSLKIGETIDIKGPKGHMEYLGNGGNYWIKPVGKPKQTKQCNQFIMIAGGTGITPMLQVANYMFRSNDSVKVHLLYANQTKDDILCRKELEAMVKEFPDKMKVQYTIDRPPTDGSWKGSVGFISKEMIEEHCVFNGSSKNTQVFLCGPPPMLKYACFPHLKELGFTKDDWFAF